MIWVVTEKARPRDSRDSERKNRDPLYLSRVIILLLGFGELLLNNGISIAASESSAKAGTAVSRRPLSPLRVHL